VTPELTNPD